MGLTVGCDDTTDKTHGTGGIFRIGYHVVCLLDLLGQQDALAEWAKIPNTPQPPKEFTDALNHTAGAVLKFRKVFLDYFASPAWNELPPMDSLPEAKNPDFQAFCRRCKEANISAQQFSDTFVFYAPMLNSHGDVTSWPLLQMIGACCSIMVDSLAAGVPLRGALCIGPGIQLGEQNFYGPALAEAHHLESEVAKGPRIVVSPTAFQFADACSDFSQDRRVNLTMENMARACRPLMCNDDDGNAIVDFLGKGMHSIGYGAIPHSIENIEKAYRFVCREFLRFKEGNNHKLAERYATLRRYIDSRLPIWSLGHLAEGHDNG